MINQMNDAECNHETRRAGGDDDTAICALLQDVLSEHVFTVSVCHTGQEAILRIEGDPDIALVVLGT